MADEMNLLKFFRALKGAASSVNGLLEIARCTCPDPAKLPREAVDTLVSDALAAELLFKDIDAVIEGAAWLRAEIAQRRSDAVTT
jgi:hypothetical protein